MVAQRISGRSPLERVRHRYETTDKKCTACGYVDEGRNWTSQTNGRKVIYRHICPSCDAERDHTYKIL